jgi:thiamine kinase-like enzyme
VLYFIEPEGYLVTRFVDGRRIPPEEMAKPDNIRRVARKLRLYHTRAPEVKGEFDVFRRVRYLAETAKQHGCKLPIDLDWITARMNQAEEALSRRPYPPRPCHCDLLNLNFLDENVQGEKGEVRIVDWEYAGMGDVFYDLANYCHHHRFNDEQVEVLLGEYFSEVTPRAFARLKLMWPMSEIHEAVWGTVQTRVSKLDEDFEGYANLWFGRVREDLTDPRWDKWLSELRHD